MNQFTFVVPADADELYSPDAFGPAIGQPTTVSVLGRETIPARVVAAEVDEDGRAVKVTVEVDRMPALSSDDRLSLGIQPSR